MMSDDVSYEDRPQHRELRPLLTIFMQLFTLLTILITYATYKTNTYTTCITYNNGNMPTYSSNN